MSKTKFRKPSKYCERVFNAIKIKKSITCQKFGSRKFLQIANKVLNKSYSAIVLLCLMVLKSCPLHQTRQRCEIFSENPKLFGEILT